MRLYSWNINGIRAILKKGFLNFLEKEKLDVLCLQEIKIGKEARLALNFSFPSYQDFWNSAKRPGYSGTMTLVREGIGVKELPSLKWDDEGRVQILEFDKFYLVNVYFPNANHELSRLDFKINFNNRLLKHLKKLELKKAIIICGDFNVAHQEIDLARPKENVGSPGFTYEERDWMDGFLKGGFIDTFRYHNPKKIQYSWWSYRAAARARNIGWRIDYFCASDKIIKRVKKSFILDKILGSDHCPVGIEV